MKSEEKFEIEWLAEVDSTNLEMRRRIEAGLAPADGTVLATSNQTAGRGRAGRVWRSGSGRNLCFSLLVAGDTPAADLPALGMAAVLGVDDLMHAFAIDSRPKWPNDLRVHGRKICGILSETTRSGAIVGIGINVDMDRDEAGAIDQPATSMLIETGSRHGPRDVLRDLLPRLARRIAAWRRSRFAGLRREWCERVEGLGAEIEIVNGQNKIRGRLEDFGPHGECRLRTDDGELHPVWSGDAHIRKPGCS